MKRQGIKTAIALMSDAEARMRDKDARIDERIKHFRLGAAVDVPFPFGCAPIEKVSREELLKRYPPIVVTKVDRKRGKITLESKP